ncbi:hypothetical protein [uncultured Microbacterium sp.]|uniref:hypothetical protein n=1 Tax=uncultured Microbacterium sp. TaxID=191216 RepID=UPI0028D86737|nr:hypothetical protein [uncultured Microbacterium sp.]
MGYSFFVRFSLDGSGWNVDEDRLTLVARGSEELWIDANGPLRDASRLVLRGTEYETQDAAQEAGERALAALRISLVQTHSPADFHARRSMGQWSEEALAHAQEAGDAAWEEDGSHPPRPVLKNESPGVIVHPSDEVWCVIRGSATGVVVKVASALVDEYASAIEVARVDKAADLAFDLWSAASRMPSGDSRFLTLVNAVEALADQLPIAGEEREAINRLRSEVKRMDLEPDVRQSLLDRLIRRESVGMAIRRLLANVSDKVYDNESATDFFSRIYRMRSRLTHGDGAPTHHEVAAVTNELGNLVRDLITRRYVPLLEHQQRRGVRG